MAAVPPSTVAAERSACPFCRGAGTCGRCEGTGALRERQRWFRRRAVRVCYACDGSGRCQLCHGAGVREARTA